MLAVKSLTLCVLFCLGRVTADFNTVFSKEEKYKGKTLIYGVNIRNSLMTIATCGEPTNKCKVSQVNMDSKSESASCEFVLDKNLRPVSGYTFTANKAIFMSMTRENSEEKYAKLTIINFPDCKTAEAKINLERSPTLGDIIKDAAPILINEDDTFDVLYNDTRFCGNKVCRFTLDAQGNKVKGPIASYEPLNDSLRLFVEKLKSSPDFIVTEVTSNGITSRTSLIKPDAQLVLKEYKVSDELKAYDVSTSHGLIRLCSETETAKVDCELLDNSNGETISKISVDTNQKFTSFTVQNLANGEFLLLFKGKEAGALMKVKDDGSVSGVAEVSHFDEPYLGLVTYIDFSNNQYCITRQGVLFHRFKVLKECYAESDFH